MCGRLRKVDVRLPGKGNSNNHGARPVHLIITMIKWIRTSGLSIKKFLSVREPEEGRCKATWFEVDVRLPGAGVRADLGALDDLVVRAKLVEARPHVEAARVLRLERARSRFRHTFTPHTDPQRQHPLVYIFIYIWLYT